MKSCLNQAQWYKSVIPVPEEAGQEDREYEASLSYVVRLVKKDYWTDHRECSLTTHTYN